MTNRKKKTLRKVLVVIVVILAIIAILFGTGAWYIIDKLSKVNYIDISEEDIEINEGVEIGEEYRNIAIFGVDSRKNTYTNTRSDCIIIVSLNQKTKEINLVSVYRDTYVDITGHGLDKITHAYAYGGAELALSTLNKNLDLNITQFITVNFYSVIDIINAIGGVQIDIDSDELQYLNSYIQSINSDLGKSSSTISGTGIHTLDGVQALAYSRIRYTSGGDYKRTERMRTVLEAVFEKAKKLSITKINSLIDDLLPEVYTNIDSMQILSLAPQILQYKVNDSIGWPYQVKGITLDRWYGVPVTLESCVKQLHKEIFEETDYVPSDTVKNISQSIIKKTGYK